MRKTKEKLTAQDIIDFFAAKLLFDRSEKDNSTKYGWPSTKEGLYSISDFYNYFETKGFTKNDVDDVKYKYFQNIHDYSIKMPKLEKGKTHFLKLISVTNYNPDYKRGSNFMSTPYYYFDISDEKAKELKAEYEAESKKLMQELTEKYNQLRKTVQKSAAQKQREEKKKTPRKPRTKKSPEIQVLVA
jgi:transposase